VDLLVPRGCVLTCFVNYLIRARTPNQPEALDLTAHGTRIPLVYPEASIAAERVTRHFSLVTRLLTGTPKQLEIAVSQTKQSSRPAPNRDTNSGSSKSLFEHSLVAPSASPVSGVRWTPPESRDRTCRRISAPVTALNIPSNLEVRLPAAPSARPSLFHFPASLFHFLSRSNRNSKLLETSVTQTKQSSRPSSNRDKIAGCSTARSSVPGTRIGDIPLGRTPRERMAAKRIARHSSLVTCFGLPSPCPVTPITAPPSQWALTGLS
jgi:hypothetical protein